MFLGWYWRFNLGMHMGVLRPKLVLDIVVLSERHPTPAMHIPTSLGLQGDSGVIDSMQRGAL